MAISENIIQEFIQSLLSNDRLTAKKILEGSGQNENPLFLVEKLISPSLDRIGIEWEQGKLALSQIYMSGRICEELVDVILPPDNPSRKNQPRMAIAVLNDYHLLGKRIVYSTLRAGGFELLDYGRVDARQLVEYTRKDRIEVLLISTLMLPSALRIREVKAGLVASGPPVKIIVGGAPFRLDKQLWKDVGADATGVHASEALALVDGIIGGL